MKRITLMLIVLTCALLAPTSAFAQISCSREGLQRAVDLYITAQTKGDYSGMPLATNATTGALSVGYMENVKPADITMGLIKTPMKIDHQRSFLDTSSCQTLTEVIVTDKEKPYVFVTRMRVNHDKIAELEIIWSTTGYWGFSADAYLQRSSAEKWDTIPAANRDTRGTLVSAANAYLDAFLEQKLDLVPWGTPCARTEGGRMQTQDAAGCSPGVPTGVNISNRRFVVDETLGTVIVFCTFGTGNATGGGSAAPDSHMFRVENGKLRYVHTITHLLEANFQGGAGGQRGGRGAAGAGAGGARGGGAPPAGAPAGQRQ